MLDTKKLLIKILTNLKSPVIVKTFTTPSVTVAGGGSYWVYSQNWTPTAVTGYTAIGALQATPNNQSGLVCQATLLYDTYSTRFVGVIRNITSGSLTDTIAIPVLYIRNDLL